jgi:cobalt transporter subunit CbtA
MLRAIISTGLLAGLIAGLFVTFAQLVRVTPLILEAETYEVAAAVSGDGHTHEAWSPADGIERTLFTALANIIGGIGFALLLVAIFAFRGASTDFRSGINWGLAGFAAFTLAPALGLPPELPGTDTADLLARQTWWLGTVVATGTGLALALLQQQRWVQISGVLLITIPHLIGAPHPSTALSIVPAELAAQFAVASLFTAGLFWVVLGGLCGHFYARFVESTALT